MTTPTRRSSTASSVSVSTASQSQERAMEIDRAQNSGNGPWRGTPSALDAPRLRPLYGVARQETQGNGGGKNDQRWRQRAGATHSQHRCPHQPSSWAES